MVQFFEFVILVIVVSVSGVMAPGPLFTANIAYGLKEGTRSGIEMAIGHTIVELPLVILLGIGVFSLESFPKFRIIISIFGAITLFVFAAIQIKTIFEKKRNKKIQAKTRPTNYRNHTYCIKSIFHNLVVDNWIQVNLRCHANLGIYRHTDCVCSAHLDGFCMVRSNFIFCI
jgi:threonine/homoserine/homoserine lactone efflux protein